MQMVFGSYTHRFYGAKTGVKRLSVFTTTAVKMAAKNAQIKIACQILKPDY